MSLRILEFGNGTAAGYCGRLFALRGADVIRVDSSDIPDTPDDRALDCYLHAGKRRVSLDYAKPEGRQLLSDLAGASDVLVTDGPPSMLDALDWLSLGEENDSLIRVSISPFGLSGPWRDWHGPGAVLLAMGGYTAIIGDPAREPLTIPGNYVEYQAGQFACIGAMAALLEENRQSRTIEISMLEAVLSLSQFTTVMWTCNREIRQRHGNGWSNLHPINLYPCKDGWFFVNIVPTFWDAFTRMLGKPELKEDPRFARSASRVQNREALDEIIVECLGHYTMDELLEMGQRAFRVPTGTMFSMSDVLSDDHLQARNLFHTITDADGRQLRSPSLAFREIEDDAIRGIGNLELERPGASGPREAPDNG